MRGLTEKQKAFCMGILEGKTQYQAYVDAFDTMTTNRQTIDTKAYQLLQMEKIQNYLSDMREKLQERVEWRQQYKDLLSIEDRKRIITDRIKVCTERGDDAAIARYMELLNKMDGVYINITKDITDKDTAISELSTDELKALIDSDTTDNSVSVPLQ